MDNQDLNQEQVAANQVACVNIADQLLLSNYGSGRLLLLNQTASLIWDLYRQGYSEPDIAARFKASYDVNLEQALNDVNLFLEHCRLQKLFDIARDNAGIMAWGEKIRSDQFFELKQEQQDVVHSYQIAGTNFNVSYSDSNLAAQVHPVLAHLQSQTQPPQLAFRIQNTGQYYSIQSDHSASLPTQLSDIDEVIESIQAEVTNLCYRGGDWLTVLHAAAVGDGRNNAIVFVAPRGRGKSTLVRFLQNYGFIFLSDDIVPIERNGELCPVPLCQRIKQGSWDLFKDNKPESLLSSRVRHAGHKVKYFPPLTGNQKQWQQHWTVSVIIYPHYQAQATVAEFKSLSPLESLEKLCASESVFGGFMDQQRLQSLVDWVHAVPAFEFNYSRIDDTAIGFIKHCF